MPSSTPSPSRRIDWRKLMRGIARCVSQPRSIVVIVAACASGSPSPAPPSVAAPASVEPSRRLPAPSVAASVAPSAAADRSSEPGGVHVQDLRLFAHAARRLDDDPGHRDVGRQGAPFHDVPEADQFVGPPPASAWFFGAPTKKDLAARVKESHRRQRRRARQHLPAGAEVQDPIEIGGEPGMLLGFNCGILINNAITVHDGMAYLFGFRDPAVHAATDPNDRAVFLELLKSVTFPS